MKELIDQLVESKSELIRETISKLDRKPRIHIINASNDPASQVYIKKKIEMMNSLGIEGAICEQPERVAQRELEYDLKANYLNADGLLVQLPVWDHLNSKGLIEAIPEGKDLDSLQDSCTAKIINDYHNATLPCTAQACIDVMRGYFGDDLTGLNVAIIGRSPLVGQPLSLALTQEDCTVTLMHSHTHMASVDWDSYDVVVSATGHIGSVRTSWFKVKKEVRTLIIDVGINRDYNKKLCGDVIHDSFAELGDIVNVTPVPGGIGRLTVLNVAANLCSMLRRDG